MSCRNSVSVFLLAWKPCTLSRRECENVHVLCLIATYECQTWWRVRKKVRIFIFAWRIVLISPTQLNQVWFLEVFLYFLSMWHTQTSEAKATEGSSPCSDTNEWNCLCKPFSVYKALKGHCDTFEIPRVIKLQLSTDPIIVHDVSFAFLLPFSRRTLLQNGLMCNLILWIFQEA